MKKIIFFSLLLNIICSQKNVTSKSNWIAVKSLILPGIGNYQAGNKSLAYIYFAIDLSLWFGYFYTKNQAKESVKDYRSFAVGKLGLENKVYNEQYYQLIAKYDSYESYIDFQRRQEQAILSDLSPSMRWLWKSKIERASFAQKRLDAIEKKKDIKFWIYGLVLNRITSFFLTMRDLNTKKVYAFTSASYTPIGGNQLTLNIRFDM